jgi:polysaccharide export outer membrane protein
MVRVSRQGEIELPYVGKIKVGGMVLEDVEKAIQTAYVPKVYKDLIAHVEVVLPETTNVLVVGAVTRPGLVQLRRTQRSLLHAIVGAEGASSVASGLVTLRRLRRPAEEVTLNLRDPEELRASLTLDPLEQGDIVTVQAAMPNTIFVGGLVMTAHPQPYPPGIAPTVLQAIAASGGLRTDVTPREATLIRRMPDGRDVHVKLNLDRITTGQDRNIELAAGDILWVPDTVETRVQDWINRNIFLRAGVSATWNISYNTTGLNWLNNNAKAESLANQGTTGTTSGSQASQFNALDFLGRNALLQNLAAP